MTFKPPFSTPKVRINAPPGVDPLPYLGAANTLLFKVRSVARTAGVPVYALTQRMPGGLLLTAAVIGSIESVTIAPVVNPTVPVLREPVFGEGLGSGFALHYDMDWRFPSTATSINPLANPSPHALAFISNRQNPVAPFPAGSVLSAVPLLETTGGTLGPWATEAGMERYAQYPYVGHQKTNLKKLNERFGINLPTVPLDINHYYYDWLTINRGHVNAEGDATFVTVKRQVTVNGAVVRQLPQQATNEYGLVAVALYGPTLYIARLTYVAAGDLRPLTLRVYAHPLGEPPEDQTADYGTLIYEADLKGDNGLLGYGVYCLTFSPTTPEIAGYFYDTVAAYGPTLFNMSVEHTIFRIGLGTAVSDWKTYTTQLLGDSSLYFPATFSTTPVPAWVGFTSTGSFVVLLRTMSGRFQGDPNTNTTVFSLTWTKSDGFSGFVSAADYELIYHLVPDEDFTSTSVFPPKVMYHWHETGYGYVRTKLKNYRCRVGASLYADHFVYAVTDDITGARAVVWKDIKIHPTQGQSHNWYWVPHLTAAVTFDYLTNTPNLANTSSYGMGRGGNDRAHDYDSARFHAMADPRNNSVFFTRESFSAEPVYHEGVVVRLDPPVPPATEETLVVGDVSAVLPYCQIAGPYFLY